MKLVVSSSELLKGIMTVSGALPKKTTEAILENYLFALKGDTLRITASDKEISLRTEVPVQNTLEEGRIAVPVKHLEFLKTLADQPITIGTTGENTLECSWGTGASTLSYNNPDDYPVIKTPGEGAITVSIPAESLAKAIGSTAYAASNEDNRPIMNSIFFDITPDGTTLVASDLQKLVCYSATDLKAGQNASFILNRGHAVSLKKILGKEENVEISFDDKVIEFRFGGTTAICNLVLGKYPAYKTIIPQNNSNILTISRTLLLNTVQRISMFSPKGSNHIKLEFSGNSLEVGSLAVSAQDTGFEIAGHDTVACSYEGDDLTIGFKSTHLIDMLSNLSCDTVVIKFADKRRAALVLPSEEEAAEERVFGIVMPVMVR